MKSSIKTCLVKSGRIVNLTKFTFCTAVILSLAFTANLSAVPTTTFKIDADTFIWTPDPVKLNTYTALTTAGTITFVGEFKYGSSDPEFITAGASENTFNIVEPGSLSAELLFDFDVESVEFIYGGNTGSIDVNAFDEYGGLVAFYRDPNTNTLGGPAGPITLSGSGITSLYWTDTQSSIGYAALDDITITVGVIPSPTAFVLAGIGVSFVGWLRRRKVV